MHELKKFITIKDIARAAGVSINTVSRALGNRGYVKKDTKEKILKIAQELGYTPNCAATALRTRKSGIVGVIVVDNSNPFYAELVKGIESEARKNGYNIILINTDRNYENEVKAIQTLLKRRVDGLIICAVQSQVEDIKELVDKKIPNVIVGSKLNGIKTNYVCSDDEMGGYIAAKHLIETGHRKLLFLNAFDYKYAARMREKGARRAIAESGKVVELSVINSLEGFENAYKKFKEVISKSISFDGVLCYNDIYAFAVIKVAKESGFKIPEDFSLIGFDDIEFSSVLNPSLTTIRVDKVMLGSQAFKALIKSIKEDVITELTLPVQLVERETVKRIKLF